jgi:hypothetical protein
MRGAYTKIIAWCPDDTDEDGAREYSGTTPEEIAEQHAAFMRDPCDPCSGYTVRVRATNSETVHAWDILVNVEVESSVSFRASHVFRLSSAVNNARPW